MPVRGGEIERLVLISRAALGGILLVDVLIDQLQVALRRRIWVIGAYGLIIGFVFRAQHANLFRRIAAVEHGEGVILIAGGIGILVSADQGVWQ